MSQPDEMRRDPLQLHEHHADVLRALWDLETEQLFDRQAIHQVVAKGVEVVHAIGKRDGLGIGLVLAAFFNARVEISEIRNGADHVLAVQFQQDAQHAVRRRVLGSHVENHRFRRANRCLYRRHALLPARSILALSFDGEIPAKRRSFKIVWQ